MSGAAEFFTLARDLENAGPKALAATRSAMQAGALLLKTTWAANAVGTSGVHGKHYPSSITYETRMTGSGAEGEVGPDSSRPQGRMGRGFEYGSINQPPHLDGLKAAETVGPAVEKLLDDAIFQAMP